MTRHSQSRVEPHKSHSRHSKSMKRSWCGSGWPALCSTPRTAAARLSRPAARFHWGVKGRWVRGEAGAGALRRVASPGIELCILSTPAGKSLCVQGFVAKRPGEVAARLCNQGGASEAWVRTSMHTCIKGLAMHRAQGQEARPRTLASCSVQPESQGPSRGK